MKILCLADRADPMLWEYLDRRRLEGVELILSAGDLPAEYLSFLTCFTHAPILYVHGNHDVRYKDKPPEGCICVEDTVYTYKGIRIVGLGGSMLYSGGDHQYSERSMRRRIGKLFLKLWRTKGFDILLTHAPARGVGDCEDLCHRGFDTFLAVMDRYHPQVMVHGHVHDTYGFGFRREREYHGVRVINVCGSYVLEL